MSILADIAALDDEELQRVMRFVLAECFGRGLAVELPGSAFRGAVATELDELERDPPDSDRLLRQLVDACSEPAPVSKTDPAPPAPVLDDPLRMRGGPDFEQ